MSGSISPELEAIIQEMRHAAQTGMPAQQVADFVFNAIRAEQFYILTHPEFTPVVQERMENIIQQRNPA